MVNENFEVWALFMIKMIFLPFLRKFGQKKKIRIVSYIEYVEFDVNVHFFIIRIENTVFEQNRSKKFKLYV